MNTKTDRHTDNALMARLKNGDTAALGELYMRYGKMVTGALMRFAGGVCEEDRLDLCQDVFMTLADTCGRFKPGEELKPWIYGIAVSTARNWRRKRSRRLALAARNPDMGGGVSFRADSSPEHLAHVNRSVDRVLDALPEEQLELLLLYEVEGFDGPQIAAMMGLSLPAVWTRLHRYRKKILDALEEPAAAESSKGGVE